MYKEKTEMNILMKILSFFEWNCNKKNNVNIFMCAFLKEKIFFYIIIIIFINFSM